MTEIWKAEENLLTCGHTKAFLFMKKEIDKFNQSLSFITYVVGILIFIFTHSTCF